MTICTQISGTVAARMGCLVYDFQTLLTGLVAGIPVWRQLKDTNLQTRISHRETLANLLRDTLQRYANVSGDRFRSPVR